MRIERAYKEGKKFKVYVFVPLLPGFPGDVEKSQTLKAIVKYTYRTICRNKGVSIIEYLYGIMGDKWRDYIGFYSLRNHGVIGGVARTELIYIHAKLLIVDDEKVIIGSANINDRSMLGKRDSEVCVLIEDKNETNRVNSVLDGQAIRASNYALTLRLRLFKVIYFNSRKLWAMIYLLIQIQIYSLTV
jgi:phospholipase D1/2